MTLELLRFVPSGTEGHSRGVCESCGLFIWSDGGYRVPSFRGIFCSLACIECGIAENSGRTKRIAGAPIGSGSLLLAHLRSVAPELYAKLSAELPATQQNDCLECGASLDGKRADSEFCSDAHRKRFRKSQPTEKARIIAETPIQNTLLTEAQFVG